MRQEQAAEPRTKPAAKPRTKARRQESDDWVRKALGLLADVNLTFARMRLPGDAAEAIWQFDPAELDRLAESVNGVLPELPDVVQAQIARYSPWADLAVTVSTILGPRVLSERILISDLLGAGEGGESPSDAPSGGGTDASAGADPAVSSALPSGLTALAGAVRQSPLG